MKTISLMFLLCLNQMAAAEVKPSGVLIPGLNLPVLAAPAANGKLDVTHTDIGQLMNRQMVEYFRRQQEDAKYFVEQLQNLESLFLRLNTLVTAPHANGAAKTYADLVNDSVRGDFASAEDFLKVRAQIVAEEQALRTRLSTLRALNAGALPSARLAVTENKSVEMPGQYNLNFNPIADYYEGQLKVIGEYLNRQSLSFLDKIGVKIDVHGLEFDCTQLHSITESERKVRQAEIVSKRKDAASAWAAQDRLTREIIRGVKQVLELRGVEERGRFVTAMDAREREGKVERLSEALLYHSYLRLKFRQPVGTFYIEYKPLSFNRDQLKFNPVEYVQAFSNDSVRNLADVEKSVTNFQRAVLAGGMRQKDGDVFLLSSALSGWDFLRGWSTLSRLGLQVFQMLYADALDEIALNTGTGVETFDQNFKDRYLATPESKAKTLAIICAVDSDVPCATARANAGLGGIEMSGGYNSLMSEALLQTQARLNSLKQAADLQRTLDDLTNLPNSGFAEKVRGNIGILR